MWGEASSWISQENGGTRLEREWNSQWVQSCRKFVILWPFLPNTDFAKYFLQGNYTMMGRDEGPIIYSKRGPSFIGQKLFSRSGSFFFFFSPSLKFFYILFISKELFISINVLLSIAKIMMIEMVFGRKVSSYFCTKRATVFFYLKH